MKKIHRVTQGDSFSIKVPLLIDGVASLIDGWSFWMTVKRSSTDLDAAAVFQKTSAAAQIVPYDATTVVVEGVPADTKDKATGRCDYDIQGKAPDGKVHTLESGFFYIDPEITSAS